MYPVLQGLRARSSICMSVKRLDSLLTLLDQVFRFKCFAVAAFSWLVSSLRLISMVLLAGLVFCNSIFSLGHLRASLELELERSRGFWFGYMWAGESM